MAFASPGPSIDSIWQPNSLNPSSASGSEAASVAEMEDEGIIAILQKYITISLEQGGQLTVDQFVARDEEIRARRLELQQGRNLGQGLGGALAAAEAAGAAGAPNGNVASPAVPVAAVPIDPCAFVEVVEFEEAKKTITEEKCSEQSEAPTGTIVDLIQRRLASEEDMNNRKNGSFNPKVDSGFEVLANPSHKYYSTALKVFIACFLLDGLGHDQIYGPDPPVKEMVQACIKSFGEHLTPNDRIELKTAVVKKDGINDSNAKSTILALCKELRILLGIDLPVLECKVNGDVVNVAEDENENAHLGGGRAGKNVQNTYRRKHARGSKRPGRFNISQKHKVQYRDVKTGKLVPYLPGSVKKIISQEELEERKIKKEKKKQTASKKQKKQTAEEIATKLDPERERIGREASQKIRDGIFAGSVQTAIGFSVDSLTSGSYKSMISDLKTNAWRLYALNTASSRGDPASFNPEQWSANNEIEMATYRGDHTTHGAVGFPLLSQSTKMRLREDISNPATMYVEKSAEFGLGKTFTAVFRSQDVTITSIRDLAELIQGRAATIWRKTVVEAAAGRVVTYEIAGTNTKLVFTGDFSQVEELLLGCGLKTDGDIGGLRFISGVQDEVDTMTYAVGEDETIHGNSFFPMTMTFDIICGEEATTFSGKSVCLMKPSGDIYLKKPSTTPNQDITSGAEPLTSFVTNVKTILRSHLPLYGIRTVLGRSDTRKKTEKETSILKLRKIVCEWKRINKKLGESSTMRDFIDACEDEELKRETETLYESLQGHGPFTQEDRALIDEYLTDNKHKFDSNRQRFYTKKYADELKKFWRKGLSIEGKRFADQIFDHRKSKLEEKVTELLTPFRKKMGGFSILQSILITILKGYTSKLVQETIIENLLHNKIFNDPIAIVDTNNFSLLSTIYSSRIRYNEEISNFKDAINELQSNLNAIFTTKWISTSRFGIYQELKNFFINLGFSAYCSNIVSVYISAFLYPLPKRNYAALTEEAVIPLPEEEEEEEEEDEDEMGGEGEEEEEESLENTNRNDATSVIRNIDEEIHAIYKQLRKDEIRLRKEYITKTKTNEYQIATTIIELKCVNILLQGKNTIHIAGMSGGGRTRKVQRGYATERKQRASRKRI